MLTKVLTFKVLMYKVMAPSLPPKCLRPSGIVCVISIMPLSSLLLPLYNPITILIL